MLRRITVQRQLWPRRPGGRREEEEGGEEKEGVRGWGEGREERGEDRGTKEAGGRLNSHAEEREGEGEEDGEGERERERGREGGGEEEGAHGREVVKKAPSNRERVEYMSSHDGQNTCRGREGGREGTRER
eukprot:1843130-Rhodomonas_salina.1